MSITFDLLFTNQAMSKQNNLILCEECYKDIDITTRWCTPCNGKRFEKNFSEWTSGSAEIDKFIRESQTTSERHETVLEWVDPLKFRFLEKVKFSKNNIAYWEDGYILNWNAEKREWDRKSRQRVKLVTHLCEKYLTSHFRKSVKSQFCFIE